MRFTILTLFPKAFDSYLNESILKRARKSRKIIIDIVDIRKFTSDKHYTADGRPFGGGPGMVMKAEPILKAIEKVKRSGFKTKIILTSAGGRQFDDAMAKRFAKNYSQFIFIAGHYEGIDERVEKILKAEAISVGPYVLTGGELPAMVMLDSIARYIAGVLGKQESLESARYGVGVPAYTRPEALIYKGKKYSVPAVLLSGDHKKIEESRRAWCGRKSR